MWRVARPSQLGTKGRVPALAVLYCCGDCARQPRPHRPGEFGTLGGWVAVRAPAAVLLAVQSPRMLRPKREPRRSGVPRSSQTFIRPRNITLERYRMLHFPYGFGAGMDLVLAPSSAASARPNVGGVRCSSDSKGMVRVARRRERYSRAGLPPPRSSFLRYSAP